MSLSNSYAQLRRVFVNPIQFQAIIGRETSHISVIDIYNYKVGELIVIACRNNETRQVNGLFVIRYVCKAHSFPGLCVDEDYTELCVSPFKPTIS